MISSSYIEVLTKKVAEYELNLNF